MCHVLSNIRDLSYTLFFHLIYPNNRMLLVRSGRAAPTTRRRRHALAVARMTPDWLLDDAGRFHLTSHQREVLFFHRSCAELPRQGLVGVDRTRDENDARD